MTGSDVSRSSSVGHRIRPWLRRSTPPISIFCEQVGFHHDPFIDTIIDDAYIKGTKEDQRLTKRLSYATWTSLRHVADSYTEDGIKPTMDRAALFLDAATETVAEVIFNASAEELRAGALAAKLAHDRIVHGEQVTKASPDYQAGRAATLTDMLAYVASRTASATLESLARRNPFATMLAVLSEGPLSNKALAERVNLSVEQTCRNLRRLREVGAVSPQPRGREVFNRLTPSGRLMVQVGVQAERRAPSSRRRCQSFRPINSTSMKWSTNRLRLFLG